MVILVFQARILEIKVILTSAGGGGLLFDAYDEDELHTFLPYINVALKKYKIRFRARFFTQGNNWGEMIREILQSLQNTNPNRFVIDDSWKMSIRSYQESFLLVCGKTTMKNTFPLLTLCPSLVLSNKANVLNENLGISLALETSPENFLECVSAIDSHREMWRKRILHYRENDVYNFGCASAYLAEFIVNLLKEK